MSFRTTRAVDPPAADAGSATIFVLAILAVLAAASGLVVTAGFAVAARHRGAAIADAASLAAAAVVDAGPRPACDRAGAVARLNGAVASGCRVVGPVVTVQITLRPGGPLAWLGPLRLNSRAGPAETNMDHPGQPAAPS